MKQKIFRQGDVLIRQINKLPANLSKKDSVLAYGEITGHRHQLMGKQASVLVDTDGQQYLELEQESELVHEEHEKITLPKGKYEVILQREFDIVEGVRQVMD